MNTIKARMTGTALAPLLALLLAIVLASGCGEDPAVDASAAGKKAQASLQVSPAETGAEVVQFSHNDAVVWAVNVGGPEYVGVDGVAYRADEKVNGGETGRLEGIKGSQDGPLYESYRHGAIAIKRPLENGVYDIIFKFAEIDGVEVGERMFDVYAQGQLVIDDLDVRLARDGKTRSALERAITGVEVTDGQLEIEFRAAVGEPLLSALVVRKKSADSRVWELLWSDEFDYSGAPDPAKWSFDIWPSRKVNDEDQAYTDRPENVRVADGNLVIEAHKEDYQGAEYTSGRIHSQGKGDFLYGRAEVRARLPAGQGTWSAIWMLPSDPFRYATSCEENEDWQGSSTCDAWPNSGEIDIMEHVGYDMQTIHGTVHNKAYYWVNWEQRKGSVEGRNVDNEFHVYAIEWTPQHIYILFDGTPYFYYANESSGWQAWPYDHPFHIILNLAIGGNWGRAGGPIDDSIFPVRMEVDYVRVFKPATDQ